MSSAFCQSVNSYIQVTNTITNYSLTTAAGLETIQNQTNAFKLIVKSRYNNYYVSARVSDYSSSSGAYLAETMLGIKLNNVSPARTTSNNIFYMGTNDQQIISGQLTGTQAYTYSYDLMFGPIGYDVPPGTYNATILFTLSQP